MVYLEFLLSFTGARFKEALQDCKYSTHDDENHQDNDAENSDFHPSILDDPILQPVDDSMRICHRVLLALLIGGRIVELICSES